MRRLLTPRWIAWHLITLALVAGCLALGWWQIGRARSGNLLSFGYAIQWPVFAAFVAGLWVRELRLTRRRDPGGDGPDPATPADPLLMRVPERPRPVAPEPPDDGQLDAYNRYLAWLAEHPDRSPGDYPG